MSIAPERGLEHPERAALPLHLSRVAAALFDNLPPPVAAGDVDQTITELVRGRDRLGAVVPAGTELVIDAYRVRLAAACPASAIPSGNEFHWSPGTAARFLGLRALALHRAGQTTTCSGRSLNGAIQPVEQAVAAVMAEYVGGGGERTPGPWLAQLGASGQAVVHANAQRWAEQAATWLPLGLIGPRALHFLGDDWWPSRSSGGRTLVLHGRRDLTVDSGGRRVAVTLASGTARRPGAAQADAVGALAAMVGDARGRLARVVRVHPASGEVVAVNVTVALLQQGVSAVLATASALARGLVGAEVPTSPGAACTWCDRRQDCQPGTAWLERPDRRVMGLPVSALLV